VESALAGFERVRVDLGDSPALGERFHVQSIPLIVIMRPDGSEIARYPGYRSPEDLLGLLAALPPAPSAGTAK
jgi:thioredoxin-like negative regulator of GroEL